MTNSQLFWTACLEHLRQQLNAQQYSTWIKPLRCELDGDVVRLQAPHQFAANWVKDRHLDDIAQFASDFLKRQVVVELGFGSGADAEAPPERDRPIPKQGGDAVESDRGVPPPPRSLSNTPGVMRGKPSRNEHSRLNPSYIFDNFVTGRANQLGRAAAIQVAENPGSTYNPLFIYGGVGLGKTHLVHAIGNQLQNHHPEAKIRYMHAEQYVSDVVRAYQRKTFDEFKRYYHSLDLLLIDDIQFFSGKNRTQEEFFYAFNALIEAHKQVVITCDTFPRDITGMEDRLTSRFGWGLTVALEPPELEMRVAILLKRASVDLVALDQDVAFFIAKHIRSNVRELEGALKRVVAFARFTGHAISLETAKEALKDLLASQNRQVSVDNIQKTVADFYKIKVGDMYSKGRSRAVARPRQVAMALAKELTQLSLPDIGKAFGGRDHTTVLHACRTIEQMRHNDPNLGHDYQVLLQMLRN